MTDSWTPDAGAGDDADAPWRPGYTGPEPKPPEPNWAQPTTSPEAPPNGPLGPDPWSREGDAIDDVTTDRTPSSVDPEQAARAQHTAMQEAPTSAGPGLVGAGGLLVVICLVVAAIAAVGLLNNGDAEQVALATIPESIDDRWSSDTGPAVDAVVADGVVVVRQSDGVRAFDGETGEELWERVQSDGPAQIDIQGADGVVIALNRASDSLVATGIDPTTGDELWNRNVAERRDLFALRERLIEYEFDEQTQSGRFAILSPETGLPQGDRLRLVDIATTPPFVSASTIDTEELVMFDVDTGERIDAPVDWEQLDAVAIAGGRLVALTGDGSLALYDDAGEVVDEIDVTLGPDQRSPSEIFSVPGEAMVVLGAAGSSVGVAIDGDVLEIRWSSQGEVRLVEQTDDGPRAILESDDAGSGSPTLVVDPIDGEVVFEFEPDEPIVRGFESDSYGRNGLIYRDGSSLVAVDGSGAQMWELVETGGFVVDDGLLVEFTDDGITVYG